MIKFFVFALVLPSMPARAAASDARHIDSISPLQGPIAGGTVVTITGSGFAHGTAVRFNRSAGINVQILSPSQLQVTTPRLGEGPFATALAAAESFARLLLKDLGNRTGVEDARLQKAVYRAFRSDIDGAREIFLARFPTCEHIFYNALVSTVGRG